MELTECAAPVRLTRTTVRSVLASVLFVMTGSLASPHPIEGAHVNPAVMTTISVPRSPENVAVNPVTNRVYVATHTINSLTVIDGATDTLMTTVPLGHDPLGLAVNSATNRIYVTHFSAQALSVVDGVTNAVVATTPLSALGVPVSGPLSVAINPATNRVYVALGGCFFWPAGIPAGGAVAIIDGNTNAVIGLIPTGGCFPSGITVNAQTNRIYVTNQTNATVAVIDGATNSLLRTVPVTARPNQIVVNPATNRIYVNSQALPTPGGTLSVIDGTTDTVMATIPFCCGFTSGVAVNPSTNRIYLANPGVATLHVIDGETHAVIGKVSIGSIGNGVGANPATDLVYVVSVDSAQGSVAVIGSPGPVANAGPDHSVKEGALVTLNGSASRGSQLAFAWKQIAPVSPGISLSDAATSHPTFFAPLLSGGFGSQVFTFELTVTSAGGQSRDTVNITVNNVNHAPEAHPGADQTVGEGSPVMLDGSSSFDPDGDQLAYLWTQTSGPAVVLSDSAAVNPTFVAPLLPGGLGASTTLTFQLLVSDGVLPTTASVNVVVDQTNHPPVANAGVAETVHSGRLVALDATASVDPDGDPVTLQWVQTGGTPVAIIGATTATPTFMAPPVSGTEDLRFELVVSDGHLSTSVDVVVTVKNGAPLCHLARAVPDTLWPPSRGLVEVRIAGVTDPDDPSVNIGVTRVTQDEPVTGQDAGGTAPDAVVADEAIWLRAERSGLGNGRVYVIAFTADDGQHGICTGSVSVSVPKSPAADAAVDDGQRFDSTQP